MPKVRIYRNKRSNGRSWFMNGRLPVNQRLYFVGSWLITVVK